MQSNTTKAAEDFRESFNKLYSARLKKYKGYKDPPWADRKNQEIVRSLAHPQIQRDLGILSVCTRESILENQQVLTEYLVKNYDLSFDMAESWVLLMATGDIRAILPRTQIDGVRFFNDLTKTAGPKDDKSAAYKNLQADVKRGDPHINIRIGRSATKQDVKWLLDHYWDEYVAPALKLPYQATEQRAKRKLLRNSTIYALYNDGKKVSDIQKYVAANFDDAIDEAVIRKVLKEFRPPVDLFKPAAETLESLDLTSDSDIDLKFIKKPTLHFQLKVRKP
jgi:hypothetical protein